MAGLQDAASGADRRWMATEDFHTVCALADFDSEAVSDRFKAERFQRGARIFAAHSQT